MVNWEPNWMLSENDSTIVLDAYNRNFEIEKANVVWQWGGCTAFRDGMLLVTIFIMLYLTPNEYIA